MKIINDFCYHLRKSRPQGLTYPSCLNLSSSLTALVVSGAPPCWSPFKPPRTALLRPKSLCPERPSQLLRDSSGSQMPSELWLSLCTSAWVGRDGPQEFSAWSSDLRKRFCVPQSVGDCQLLRGYGVPVLYPTIFILTSPSPLVSHFLHHYHGTFCPDWVLCSDILSVF